MDNFLTEKTLRNIQIMHANTKRLKNRRIWIDLACHISFLYDIYCLMRNTAAMVNVSDDDMTIEEWEEFIMLSNKFLGTEFGLSDFCVDPDKNADEAIIYYQTYKKLLKIFDGGIFKAAVAEKLFEEMYNDMDESCVPMIMNHYYSKIAEQILSYMCEKIDYNTFKQNVLAIKLIPNQGPINGTMLKNMIKTGQESVLRYIAILRSQKAEAL